MSGRPVDPYASAEHSGRKRRRYRESRRANEAKRSEAAAVLDHPDQFPPGHPLRERILDGGAT